MPKKCSITSARFNPIWNKHCTGCHNATAKAAAGLDLTATPTALHNVSYENLLNVGVATNRTPRTKYSLVGVQVNENSVRAFVEYTPPYYFGAYSSVLAAMFGDFQPHFDQFGNNAASMQARVQALHTKHKNVPLARDEFIRIANWLDASCQYYPSYWGQKNLQYRDSACFRPAVTFAEAIGTDVPANLQNIYKTP